MIRPRPLLTHLLTSLKFVSYPTNVLFLVQTPTQDHILHLVILSIYSPPIFVSFCLSSSFVTLTLLKSTSQLFCRESHAIWVCLGFPPD